MKTSEKVLQLLLKKQAFLSGQELADELNVSRTAVWKAIQSLQEEGYQIESKPRIGYRYIEGLKLSEASIRRFLNPELDLDFEIYDTIDSTNNRCSQKAMDPETKTPLVVISDSQKAGHGRYGRPFASPVGGGIYISILLDNDDSDFNPGLLTTATAIAVTRTIEKLVHARCEIKWVNDVLVDGKKIVGILTEGVADLETQLIKHVIVGTGINYLTDPSEFPEEIRQRAGSLRRYTLDSGVSRNAFIANYLNEFFSLYKNYKAASFMDEYRAHSNTIGKDVTINRSGQTSEGHVATIDNQGRLVLSSGETLSSGEVTKIRSTD